MPDPREITATLVVGFGEDSQSNNDSLVAEVDSRDDGLNLGKTRFVPGEDVYILVYPSSNVVLNTPVSSFGDLILRAGTELVDKEQDIQFIDEVESRVTYPMLSGFTSNWLGRTALGLVQTGDLTLQIAAPAGVDNYARNLRVNWTASGTVYRLTNTFLAYDEYNIICHFTGIAS